MFSMSLHATNKWDKHTNSNEERICVGQILLVYIDSAFGDMPLRQTANKLKADIIYEYKYTNALALNFSEHKKKETLIKPKGQSPYKTPGEGYLYRDSFQNCTLRKNFFQEILLIIP